MLDRALVIGVCIAIGLCVAFGATVGFGAAWLMYEYGEEGTYTSAQVGRYDLVIGPPEFDPVPDNGNLTGRAGFGISWPTEGQSSIHEDIRDGPQLLAIIDSQNLRLVDYEDVPVRLREFLETNYKDESLPTVPLGTEGEKEPSDDPR